ncbi:MAG: hypothetical protein KDD01_01750, partial [Phaeodactylibacter sp.]|nr:hypothetical protein [Phaeodactylibacter sp.]
MWWRYFLFFPWANRMALQHRSGIFNVKDKIVPKNDTIRLISIQPESKACHFVMVVENLWNLSIEFDEPAVDGKVRTGNETRLI